MNRLNEIPGVPEFDQVPFTKERALRFASSIDFFGPEVERDPPIGRCWIWTGRRCRRGYGILSNRKAHRISYEIRHGKIPEGTGYHGTCILHSCDNPSCVNPDHLRAGTIADNAADAVARGRHIGRNTGLRTQHLVRRVIRDIESQLRSCESRVATLESICANLDQTLDDGQLQIHNGDTHG